MNIWELRIRNMLEIRTALMSTDKKYSRIAGGIPQKIPGDILWRIFYRIPDSIPEEIPEGVPTRISEETIMRTSKRLLDRSLKKT